MSNNPIMLYYESVMLGLAINNRLVELELAGRRQEMLRLLKIGQKAWQRVRRRKHKAHTIMESDSSDAQLAHGE